MAEPPQSGGGFLLETGSPKTASTTTQIPANRQPDCAFPGTPEFRGVCALPGPVSGTGDADLGVFWRQSVKSLRRRFFAARPWFLKIRFWAGLAAKSEHFTLFVPGQRQISDAL